MSFDFEQDAYKALKKTFAERTSTVIAWVGAGLSAQAGLPSWQALAKHLLEVSRRKVIPMSGAEREKGLLGTLEEKVAGKDYWLAFQIAEDLLGNATYQAEVRQKLDKIASPPDSYLQLWNAGIQGMITFNLDHFAQQSFSLFKPGAKVETFIGNQAKNLGGVLQRSSHFIGNPHGVLDNASTWVFKQNSLQALLKDAGYRQFINTCLVSRTVLFAGITADDIAVETHLRTLTKNSLRGVVHYWITDRSDASTDRWAENLNIRIIRYVAQNNDHSALSMALQDLSKAVPEKDKPLAEPVLPTAIALYSDIPSAEALLSKPLEELRTQLNGYAARLLAKPDSIAYEKYRAFEEDYDEAIDRAWYVGDRPPKNKILGYTLIERVAQGSFGDVYRAETPEGDQVALKLLRRDVRREPAMLQTFRRGVRSMKILKKHGIPGMVNFIDASEIPAFVVMDWINGPNLMEAVQARALEDWHSLLRVAHQLGTIVHAAHQLPEGVLHRDIRPPNVMLRNYWDANEIDVVVMDFDLSWHMDALEKSVIAKPLVFMAPEQLHNRGGTTRSALVDSFGFGMTLYYMLTGELPVPDQQKHRDWDNTLKYKIGRRRCKNWKSLPFRIMRLVHECTRDKQSERPDFGHITFELESLENALNGSIQSISSDYYCEEVAAHAETMEGYDWDFDKDLARYQSGGLTISLEANIPLDEINLSMRWQQTGEENWKNLPKTSAQVSERAKPILERGGWSKATFEASLGQMSVSATYSVERDFFDVAKLSKAIDMVVATMLPKN